MKPLKVLILITKANWGGAQRYVYDVATSLSKDKFSVEVMAGSEGILTDKLNAAGIYASGTLEVGRDVSFFGDVKAAFRLASLLRSKKPDVLHVNSSKIGGIGAFAGRLARVPRIVFTVHGWAFNENRPWPQKLAIKFLAWLTVMLSHQTVVVSQAAMDQAKRWPRVKGKLSVIHNGISPATGYSKPNARLELVRMNDRLRSMVAGVPESHLVWIGTIAEIHHIKGHEYALRAFAECVSTFERANPGKKLVYTIIGEGEERERLQGMIDSLKLQDRVVLMGRVDNASQYIKAFDMLVLASLSESLGYVLIEAGFASVPVVATTVGGIPEIVDDMHSGILVQPKNSRDLAHAISFVIEHPKEAREYGSNLRQKVTEGFSLEKMVSETEKIYVG